MAQRKFIIDGGFKTDDASELLANLTMGGSILPMLIRTVLLVTIWVQLLLNGEIYTEGSFTLITKVIMMIQVQSC